VWDASLDWLGRKRDGRAEVATPKLELTIRRRILPCRFLYHRNLRRVGFEAEPRVSSALLEGFRCYRALSSVLTGTTSP